MGFRDLRSFNRALLAKQAWRIQSSPTSLVSRVLQGFYFQKSSFLQVKVNSRSSFVWRSILWGRGLYIKGMRRKIGSGEDTLIYHDGWLPRDGVFKISSPRVLGTFAKRFWRLRIPPKVRIFLWKAFHNWIPSLINLARQGVPTQTRCPNCNEADDTTLHALWGCKTLESLKALCDPLISFKLPPQCNFKEFILTANDCLSLENLEFLCVLLWRIWFRRNKWIHEQTWLDDDSCYSWAKQHLQDFLDANLRKEALPKKSVNTPWQAPPLGWVKINSDAAWCSQGRNLD
ncbi:hypothetical protein UlMin_018212 [Ulmus minor]